MATRQVVVIMRAAVFLFAPRSLSLGLDGDGQKSGDVRGGRQDAFGFLAFVTLVIFVDEDLNSCLGLFLGVFVLQDM